MESLEKNLQQQLSKESLLEPSAEVDDAVLELISKNNVQSIPQAVKRSTQWISWSIAALLLVVAVYMTSQLGVVSNGISGKSELDLALESSKQLELSINQLEKSNVNPAIFMEINRLNSQIASIDENLQQVLSDGFDKTAAVLLMNERIKKLTLVKSLYDSNSGLLRI